MPVILIFTKLDGLLAIAESEVEEEMKPGDDLEELTNRWADRYIKEVEKKIRHTRYPPTAFVRLKSEPYALKLRSAWSI